MRKKKCNFGNSCSLYQGWNEFFIHYIKAVYLVKFEGSWVLFTISSISLYRGSLYQGLGVCIYVWIFYFHFPGLYAYEKVYSYIWRYLGNVINYLGQIHSKYKITVPWRILNPTDEIPLPKIPQVLFTFLFQNKQSLLLVKNLKLCRDPCWSWYRYFYYVYWVFLLGLYSFLRT